MSTSEIQRIMDDWLISYEQAVRFYWYLKEGYDAIRAYRLVEKTHV